MEVAPTSLYAHQKAFLDRNPSRHLLLWETGTGKTLTAIHWALKNLPADKKALVVVPKMLRENWKRAIAPWPNSFAIVTKEEFRKHSPRYSYYPVVIFDEVHHFAGHTSQMHKSAVAYIAKHKPLFILGLTATPYSQPWNVYALANLMGRPMNYIGFRKRFYNEVFMGMRKVPIVKAGIEPELIEILHKFGSTQKLSDCIDMPDSVYETERFILTTDQKKRIKDAFDPMPVVRFTREHQITGGTLKGDEYTKPVEFDCPKAERIISLVQEHKRSMIVCRYLHEMEYLARLTGLYRPTHTLSGQTKDRDAIIQSLKGQDSYCLIVQAQCSEGWELPECPITIFYSMSWRFLDRVQMEGRIRRINHPKRNMYVTLVVDDSADEAVYDAISNKQDFQADLYAGKGLPDTTDPLGTAPHHP